MLFGEGGIVPRNKTAHSLWLGTLTILIDEEINQFVESVLSCSQTKIYQVKFTGVVWPKGGRGKERAREGS